MKSFFLSPWPWVIFAFLLVSAVWIVVGNLASEANIESIPVPTPYETGH